MTQPRIEYIVGPPGTGKTTTIMERVRADSAAFGRDRIAICSLTRTAAQEAAGRIDLPAEQIGTLHSLAYHALGGGIAIAEKHATEWNETEKQYPMASARGTTEDAPDDQNTREMLGDELLAEYSFFRARCEPIEHARPLVRQFVARWEAWKQARGYLDFTDLLTHALRETQMAPHAPAILYCDEAQDFSRLAMRLLMHWARHLDTLALVGDPYQALFDWCGGDAGAVFPATMTEHNTTVLQQSYRIPAAVHSRAMRWIRGHRDYRPFEYAPRAGTGLVQRSPWTLSDPETWVDVLARMLDADAESTVMIQAACGYMLRPLLRVLRTAGLPFHNPWRRKTAAWNPLTPMHGVAMRERLQALLQREQDGYWSPRSVRLWLEPLRVEGVYQRGKKSEVALMDSAAMTIGDVSPFLQRILVSETVAFLERATADDLVSWWHEHLLAAQSESSRYPVQIYRQHGYEALLAEPRIAVGTIHSFKGGESTIVLLAPDLSRAGWQEWEEGGAGRDAVRRQWYVGLTRTKERLILLEPSSRYHIEY